MTISPPDTLGRLPIGYGDDGPNTGPISVLLWNPANGAVANGFVDADTEQIRNYRQFADGSLWTTSEDPRGSGVAFLLTDRGGTWRRIAVDIPALTVMVHMHDVVEVLGNLYVCGSRDTLPSENGGVRPEDEGTACVWKSTNGGTTWTEVVAFHGNGVSQYNRFFSFGKIGNSLVVFTNKFEQPELTHGYFTMINGVWSSIKTDMAPDTSYYQHFQWGPDYFLRAAPFGKYTLDGTGHLVRDPLDSKGVTPLAITGGRACYTDTDGHTIDPVLGVIGRYASSAAYAADGTLYIVDSSTFNTITKVEPLD